MWRCGIEPDLAPVLVRQNTYRHTPPRLKMLSPVMETQGGERCWVSNSAGEMTESGLTLQAHLPVWEVARAGRHRACTERLCLSLVPPTHPLLLLHWSATFLGLALAKFNGRSDRGVLLGSFGSCRWWLVPSCTAAQWELAALLSPAPGLGKAQGIFTEVEIKASKYLWLAAYNECARNGVEGCLMRYFKGMLICTDEP